MTTKIIETVESCSENARKYRDEHVEVPVYYAIRRDSDGMYLWQEDADMPMEEMDDANLASVYDDEDDALGMAIMNDLGDDAWNEVPEHMDCMRLRPGYTIVPVEHPEDLNDDYDDFDDSSDFGESDNAATPKKALGEYWVVRRPSEEGKGNQWLIHFGWDLVMYDDEEDWQWSNEVGNAMNSDDPNFNTPEEIEAMTTYEGAMAHAREIGLTDENGDLKPPYELEHVTYIE